jgi:DNA-binding NarL/FixJ family response regulator
MMVRILILDNYKIVRQALKAIIETIKNMEVVADCTDANELHAIDNSLAIDIILMDIKCPEENGVNTIQLLKSKFPDSKIIVLSMESEKYIIQKILDAGARGYIMKTAGMADIQEAIKIVSKGGYFISSEPENQDIPNVLNQRKRKSTKKLQSAEKVLNHLSEREIEILIHIANEENNEEIASILGISSETVATHRKNLLQKLETGNSIGLAKIAYQNGLI